MQALPPNAGPQPAILVDGSLHASRDGAATNAMTGSTLADDGGREPRQGGHDVPNLQLRPTASQRHAPRRRARRAHRHHEAEEAVTLNGGSGSLEAASNGFTYDVDAVGSGQGPATTARPGVDLPRLEVVFAKWATRGKVEPPPTLQVRLRLPRAEATRVGSAADLPDLASWAPTSRARASSIFPPHTPTHTAPPLPHSPGPSCTHSPTSPCTCSRSSHWGASWPAVRLCASVPVCLCTCVGGQRLTPTCR
jgi:hypothetical protein